MILTFYFQMLLGLDWCKGKLESETLNPYQFDGVNHGFRLHLSPQPIQSEWLLPNEDCAPSEVWFGEIETSGWLGRVILMIL